MVEEKYVFWCFYSFFIASTIIILKTVLMEKIKEKPFLNCGTLFSKDPLPIPVSESKISFMNLDDLYRISHFKIAMCLITENGVFVVQGVFKLLSWFPYLITLSTTPTINHTLLGGSETTPWVGKMAGNPAEYAVALSPSWRLGLNLWVQVTNVHGSAHPTRLVLGTRGIATLRRSISEQVLRLYVDSKQRRTNRIGAYPWNLSGPRNGGENELSRARLRDFIVSTRYAGRSCRNYRCQRQGRL